MHVLNLSRKMQRMIRNFPCFKLKTDPERKQQATIFILVHGLRYIMTVYGKGGLISTDFFCHYGETYYILNP